MTHSGDKYLCIAHCMEYNDRRQDIKNQEAMRDDKHR